MTWPHPLTHWPTPTTHTHPWVGVSLQIINLQTELNYLDSVNNFQIFSDLTWPHPSTHPPTHPPTKLYTHPWVGESSTDFKSSNRIEISRLVQVLLNFDWFRGSPPGGGVGGWMGVRGGGRVHATHMHTHTYMHAHVYDIIGNSQVFPQWGRPFAWNYHVYHVCVCVRACACMCICVGGIPQLPPTLIHPPPHPQSRREPKTPKFNKSWTNRDNSILFEDSLPLNIPELI